MLTRRRCTLALDPRARFLRTAPSACIPEPTESVPAGCGAEMGRVPELTSLPRSVVVLPKTPWITLQVAPQAPLVLMSVCTLTFFEVPLSSLSSGRPFQRLFRVSPHECTCKANLYRTQCPENNKKSNRSHWALSLRLVRLYI